MYAYHRAYTVLPPLSPPRRSSVLMGDELAALAAITRRRHAHLDAELIGPVGFPLADAFDLGGMERIDLGATLAPVLSVDAAGEMQRPGEDLLQLALDRKSTRLNSSH